MITLPPLVAYLRVSTDRPALHLPARPQTWDNRTVSTPAKPDDLDAQDQLAAAVYFVPPAPGVEPHYAFDYDGTGPKRYLNLWLRTADEAERVTWSWVLHDSAVLLWQMKAGL